MKPLFTQGPSITARVVVFALASIALMTVDHRLPHLQSVRATLSVAVYPLQLLVNLPVATGQWLTEGLATRRTLLEENASLRAQRLVLQAQVQKLAALEAENLRLRRLFDSSLKAGERFLVAELLSVDLDPYRHKILLNKGTANGVFTGQPLLDANGIMGQILHAGPYSSTAVLISDPSQSVPVQVNRNGLRTVAVGTGTINRLDLPHLPNNSDIREGDLLITSGLGGRFPPGYPVGVVRQVERDPRQPFATVLVTPSARLERSREVLLVWKTERGALGYETEPYDSSEADE
jgi:rod shape-determining protein MreC